MDAKQCMINANEHPDVNDRPCMQRSVFSAHESRMMCVDDVTERVDLSECVFDTDERIHEQASMEAKRVCR